jgi:hypothetical protein
MAFSRWTIPAMVSEDTYNSSKDDRDYQRLQYLEQIKDLTRELLEERQSQLD